MSKLYWVLAVAALLFPSCEKVWEEDLREKAFDTIRGEYEIESAVWEGAQPIDINGDGNASFDYLSEWNSVVSGSPCYSSLHNDGGYLGVPYTVDDNAGWGGSPNLSRRREECKIEMRAVMEENEAVLEFDVPPGYEFSHTGYGEVTLRTEISLIVMKTDGTVTEMTGPVLIKYVRTRYFGE